MIHEILPSDVDFARERLSSNRPDTEIIAALASRGVESVKANQLLDDLHHGRKPDVQLPIVPQPRGEGAAHERHAGGKHSSRSKHHRAAIPWWFVILAAIALVALGYLLLEAGRSASSDAINNDKHEVPGAGK